MRKKNYSILKKYAFSVSYQDKPVNPIKIDWARVNIRDYTFTQKPGPKSNLGKVKFLMPNSHDVMLHDTFPARRKVFQKSMRAIGYGCVRMERPDRLAQVLLAEDKGWPTSEVKELWENSVNSPVALTAKFQFISLISPPWWMTRERSPSLLISTGSTGSSQRRCSATQRPLLNRTPK